MIQFFVSVITKGKEKPDHLLFCFLLPSLFFLQAEGPDPPPPPPPPPSSLDATSSGSKKTAGLGTLPPLPPPLFPPPLPPPSLPPPSAALTIKSACGGSAASAATRGLPPAPASHPRRAAPSVVPGVLEFEFGGWSKSLPLGACVSAR